MYRKREKFVFLRVIHLSTEVIHIVDNYIVLFVDTKLFRLKTGQAMIVITVENMLYKHSKYAFFPISLPPMIFTKPWVIFLISLPPGGRGTALAVEGASD